MSEEKLETADLSPLLGVTMVSHEWDRFKSILTLVANDGRHFSLGGFSTDGGSAFLEDQNGNLDDLLNSPILFAEEKTTKVPNSELKDTGCEDYYFFYEIATIKGSVQMRFYGAEGAYYTASVWFYVCTPQLSTKET